MLVIVMLFIIPINQYSVSAFILIMPLTPIYHTYNIYYAYYASDICLVMLMVSIMLMNIIIVL